jgi:hypothetical protein
LLVGFDFLGWWCPLDALCVSQCFLIVVMRPSTLGLVGANFSFLCWGCDFLHPLASSSCTRWHCSSFAWNLNVMFLRPMWNWIFPAPTSILALTSLRKGLPRMIGISSCVSGTTKSANTYEPMTFTKRFSTMPSGYLIDESAS